MIIDNMIIKMNTPPIIKPQRGAIYATPSGLGYQFDTRCYNLVTPSGFVNRKNLIFNNSYNPSGLNS